MKDTMTACGKLIRLGSARRNTKGQVMGNTNEPLIGGLFYPA
ncbi:hypothetical protein [Sphingomonas nostoxanthinifaciens]|nr:hypothetical protein [Sphingomonas nostoxanthinifaciens]